MIPVSLAYGILRVMQDFIMTGAPARLKRAQTAGERPADRSARALGVCSRVGAAQVVTR